MHFILFIISFFLILIMGISGTGFLKTCLYKSFKIWHVCSGVVYNYRAFGFKVNIEGASFYYKNFVKNQHCSIHIMFPNSNFCQMNNCKKIRFSYAIYNIVCLQSFTEIGLRVREKLVPHIMQFWGI